MFRNSPPNGDFVWAKAFVSTSTTDPYSMMTSRGIEIDSKGNIITTGWFNGSFDFDPGAGVKSVASASHDDCYILKLTADGNLIWVETIGADSYDGGNDLALDSDDNIYICGSFGPSVDYDPGPGDHTVVSPGYGPAAIIKLNSDGGFIYAALFDYLFCRRLVVDDALNVYTTGSFSSVDFDPGPDVYNIYLTD
ncbi:hypothetical protein ACQ86N_17985 [Puia sp. P3]|uniref:hypothetical protein n=1 Tax=Puia sp. P3 TaxID=3423952 RepID=UPI003D6729C4